MKNRETALLRPKNYEFKKPKQPQFSDYAMFNYGTFSGIRMLKATNTKSIDYFMKYYQMFAPLNWYHSIARYKEGIPNQDHRKENREKRREDNKQWALQHHKEMVAYDLFIDIDIDGLKEIKAGIQSLKLVHEELKKRKLPHNIRFSGNGFHVYVPFEFFFKDQDISFDPAHENNVYTKTREFSQWLYDNCSQMVDTGIYDSRRIIKIPYSLAFYQDRVSVCTPIQSMKELDNFDINYYHPTIVLGRIHKIQDVLF